MSRRSAELWVSASFLTAAAAAVGFAVAYVLGGGPQALGLLLGLACTGLAAGLLLWSARLLPAETYVEEREPLPPPDAVQRAVADSLHRGGQGSPGIVRRTFVLAGLAVGAAVVVPLRSLLAPSGETPGEALADTPWERGDRLTTREGDLVRADEMQLGTALTVFPEGRPQASDASAVVLRVEQADLRLGRAGAVGGIIAFSKLCTHAGCPVGLYEETTRQLFCPCHQSIFDVLEEARPVAGPAARALPQLPLAVDAEGYLVADGDFVGQVGPTYWRRA
jgi:ubiquinol-cytochrome c reductase iron-sulfur subunit